MEPDTTPSASDDPFESIGNFFDSGLWSAISLLLQVFIVLLWLALAYWTYQDARRRVEVPIYIAGAVALSVLIPFLGSIIWLIVRPPEYLDEARERELELLALERRLGELGDEEGKEIVGRLLARDGVVGGADAEGLTRALRQAGVPSQEEVRDLDARLTEVEFRLRMLDVPSAPEGREVGGEEDRRRERDERRRRRARDLEGGSGETGRVPRWRRPRPDPEAYD